MKLIKTTEGIRKAIKSISNRSRTLQNDIQQVAVAILEHIHEHGDWTLAVESIEGISQSKGVKSSKLTQYYEAMMQATYQQVDGKNVFVYDEGKSHADISIEMAEAVKWYDFKAPAKDTSKELEEIQLAVFKMLAKSEEAGKITETERSVVNEVLDTLVKAREAGDAVELSLAS